MKKEDKTKAIDIMLDYNCEIELNPVMNGFVKKEYLGIISAPHAPISLLIRTGYTVSLIDGRMIVDKY